MTYEERLQRAIALEADRQRIVAQAGQRIAGLGPSARRRLEREVDESSREARLITRRGRAD